MPGNFMRLNGPGPRAWQIVHAATMLPGLCVPHGPHPYHALCAASIAYHHSVWRGAPSLALLRADLACQQATAAACAPEPGVRAWIGAVAATCAVVLDLARPDHRLMHIAANGACIMAAAASEGGDVVPWTAAVVASAAVAQVLRCEPLHSAMHLLAHVALAKSRNNQKKV